MDSLNEGLTSVDDQCIRTFLGDTKNIMNYASSYLKHLPEVHRVGLNNIFNLTLLLYRQLSHVNVSSWRQETRRMFPRWNFFHCAES